MEIKAKLIKPYTKEQKIKFIVENNHKKGLVIEETERQFQFAFLASSGSGTVTSSIEAPRSRSFPTISS